MLEKLVTSTYEFLKERISSPFFVSLAIAWSIFNWQIIWTLFAAPSDRPPEFTLAIIRENHTDPLNNYWLPLCSAIAYTILYPFLSWGITVLWSWVEFRKTSIVNKINQSRLLTAEESLRLRKSIQEISVQHAQSLNAKDEEIIALRSRLGGESEPSVESVPTTVSDDSISQPLIAKINRAFQNHQDAIQEILNRVAQGRMLDPEKTDTDIITFMVLNDIIERPSGRGPC